MLISISEVGI